MLCGVCWLETGNPECRGCCRDRADGAGGVDGLAEQQLTLFDWGGEEGRRDNGNDD